MLGEAAFVRRREWNDMLALPLIWNTPRPGLIREMRSRTGGICLWTADMTLLHIYVIYLWSDDIIHYLCLRATNRQWTLGRVVATGEAGNVSDESQILQLSDELLRVGLRLPLPPSLT